MIKVLSGTLFLTMILVLSGCWNGNTAINFGDHSLGDQLIDLKKALDQGAITDVEFEETKANLLEMVNQCESFASD